MTTKRPGTEADPNIIEALPTVAAYIEKIRTTVPGRDVDDELVTALANLYRLRAYHAAILATNPANDDSTDTYQKLCALVIRHEEALGIIEKRPVGRPPLNPDPAPKPIRRQ